MKGEIKLIDALNRMDDVDRNGQPMEFSIKYMKYNEQTGVGGDFKEIKRAKKAEKKHKDAKRSQKTLRQHYEDKAKTRKDPKHGPNKTRNLWDVERSEIRKCHIHDIVRFNGLKVVL